MTQEYIHLQSLLILPQAAAKLSKDTSTKVGAVIYRPDGTVASTGRNGFPKGFPDLERLIERRDWKYELTIHAEENAILHAYENLEGYTIATYPLPPCHRCAIRIAQAGIKKVVTTNNYPQRWKDSFNLAKEIFMTMGIEYKEVVEQEGELR